MEQNAKRHLEEELRSDMEEKEHVIKALQTKVTILKNGGPAESEEKLIEVEETENNGSAGSEPGRVAALEGMR